MLISERSRKAKLRRAWCSVETSHESGRAPPTVLSLQRRAAVRRLPDHPPSSRSLSSGCPRQPGHLVGQDVLCRLGEALAGCTAESKVGGQRTGGRKLPAGLGEAIRRRKRVS